MHVDVIMLSNTVSEAIHEMTCHAIDTLCRSEDSFRFAVHLVESNRRIHRQGFVYPEVDLIVPKERFRYNRFLNLGLLNCRHEWIVVSNNDVEFTEGWFSALMRVHEKHPDILSFSPWEPVWHPARNLDPDKEYILGHRGTREVAGWCLVMHRSVVEECELFDEQFEFWYQDHDYAMTLKKHGIKHALVPGSIVHHAVSTSSERFSWWKNYRMKTVQHVRFLRKWRGELHE